MSKMGDYLQDWLNEGGYDLGYSENNLPAIIDMKLILEHSVKIWEYNGLTKREYYGG